MKARVAVVAASRAVPTPTAQIATAKREVAADVRAAKKASTNPATSGTTVHVGRTTSRFAVYQMFPKTLTVAAGQPVTFTMAGQYRSEVHTVTFGPASVRSDLEKNFVGPLPGLPPSELGLNAKGTYPSDPPPSLPPQDGTNHGDGFANTGLLDNDPSTPFPASATITFAKPGTYDYECVIHAHMDGRIVVT
jgi:plastocyanin